MGNSLVSSILRTQGEGGKNSINAAGTSDYQWIPTSDAIRSGTTTLNQADQSINNSYSNLSNMEVARDTTLADAIAGRTSPSQAIQADQNLRLTGDSNLNFQDSYLQYVSSIPNMRNDEFPTNSTFGANMFTNHTLYQGDLLGISDSGSGILNSDIKSIIGKNLSVPSATSSVSNDRRVRLRPKIGINTFAKDSTVLKPLIETNGFMFPYTPNISFTRAAPYTSYSTVHSIQEMKAYSNTAATMFTMSGTFTAQNRDEAYFMLACYHFIKACTLMSFGEDSKNISPPGTPPPVLLLSGYGNYIYNDLPVIINDFKMDMPADVDYITIHIDGSKTNLPVRAVMSITAYVQNTPDRLRKFDWGKYVDGSLMSQKGWF